MNKIFGYAANINGQDVAVAVSKTGEPIVVMSCPPQRAQFELGMEQGSTKCHDRYSNFFKGEAWNAEFVSAANIETNLGLQRAFKRSKKRYEDNFEATKNKFAEKSANDEYRKSHRLGVPEVEVEDE